MRESFWSWKRLFKYRMSSVLFFVGLLVVFSWLAGFLPFFQHEADRLSGRVLAKVVLLLIYVAIWGLWKLWRRRKA